MARRRSRAVDVRGGVVVLRTARRGGGGYGCPPPPSASAVALALALGVEDVVALDLLQSRLGGGDDAAKSVRIHSRSRVLRL